MAVNPNPTRITSAMWRTWEESQAIIPGVRLGGIYANKRGYHNYVYANQANWPGDYSIRLPLDLIGDLTKARAIDLTMSTAEMIKRTGYLKRSAEHPDDDRLGCLREFIGTLDGVRVFCMIHDTPTSAWQIDWSRDSTHLWHIHKSGFTLYCDDWAAAPGVYGWEGVISVLSGETWDAWVARKAGTQPTPQPPSGDDDMDSKQFADLVTTITMGAGYDGYWSTQNPDPYLANMAAHIGTRNVASVEARLTAKIAALEAKIDAIEGGGTGGPSGPVTVTAASVAEIAAASGKAAADEIAADPERDGRDI